MSIRMSDRIYPSNLPLQPYISEFYDSPTHLSIVYIRACGYLSDHCVGGELAIIKLCSGLSFLVVKPNKASRYQMDYLPSIYFAFNHHSSCAVSVLAVLGLQYTPDSLILEAEMDNYQYYNVVAQYQ